MASTPMIVRTDDAGNYLDQAKFVVTNYAATVALCIGDKIFACFDECRTDGKSANKMITAVNAAYIAREFPEVCGYIGGGNGWGSAHRIVAKNWDDIKEMLCYTAESRVSMSNALIF